MRRLLLLLLITISVTNFNKVALGANLFPWRLQQVRDQAINGLTTDVLIRNIARFSAVSESQAAAAVTSATMVRAGQLPASIINDWRASMSGAPSDALYYGLYICLKYYDNPVRRELVYPGDFEPLFRLGHPYRSVRKAQLVSISLSDILSDKVSQDIYRSYPKPSTETLTLLSRVGDTVTESDANAALEILRRRMPVESAWDLSADRKVLVTIILAGSTSVEPFDQLIQEFDNSNTQEHAIVLLHSALESCEAMTTDSIWQPWFRKKLIKYLDGDTRVPVNSWLTVLSGAPLSQDTLTLVRDRLCNTAQLGQMGDLIFEMAAILVFDDPEWRDGDGPTCTPFRTEIDLTSDLFRLTRGRKYSDF